jgi:putative alpha-1,2-mannosidase
MGALSVLMKIGLFEMKGGTNQNPAYHISSPIFDEIKIYLDSNYYPGGSFTITTQNNSLENKYIQNVELNEVPLEKSWIYHDVLINGGKLEYVLDESPNFDWAVNPETLPSSMSD